MRVKMMIFFLLGLFSTVVFSQGSRNIWISHEDIMKLTTSGKAWENMKKTADGNWGKPNLADQNTAHDTKVMAAALVYARTNIEAYRTKAVNALMGIIGTENNKDSHCGESSRPKEYGDGPPGARSMALGRALAAYCIAADVLNFRSGGYDPDGKGSRWESWVNEVRYRINCPNAGGRWKSLSGTHGASGSNGSSMAGGARVAAAAYLGDRVELDKAWDTFRRFCGNRNVGPDMSFTGGALTWSHDRSAPVAINPKGTTKSGRRIDGAIINDQKRGGDFKWPPGYTQYPWDGILGITAQAVILHRMGYPAWQEGDQAIRRAIEFQYHLRAQTGNKSWADGSRAATSIYVINAIYGASFEVREAGEDKNIGWTDWTHSKGSVPANVTSINGWVNTADNNDPIADVKIELRRNQGEVYRQTTSDISGRYSFNGIEPGSYQVVASKAGFASSSINVSVAKDDQLGGQDILLAREDSTDNSPPAPPKNVKVVVN